MRFTVAYVASDNGEINCYGTFGSRANAQAFADRMREDIERDAEGDKLDHAQVQVCRIDTIDAWS